MARRTGPIPDEARSHRCLAFSGLVAALSADPVMAQESGMPAYGDYAAQLPGTAGAITVVIDDVSTAA